VGPGREQVVWTDAGLESLVARNRAGAAGR